MAILLPHNDDIGDSFQIRKYLLPKELGHPLLTDHQVRILPCIINMRSVCLFLKLNWLLKCYAAGCEMDEKLCDLSSYIVGLLDIIIRQTTEVARVGTLETRCDSLSVRLDLDATLDMFMHSMEYYMGRDIDSLIEFVNSCSLHYAAHSSMSELKAPRVRSNNFMLKIVDDIFLAQCLRTGVDLTTLKAEFSTLSLRLPYFFHALSDAAGMPDLISKLHPWLHAKSIATKRVLERDAQLAFLHFVAHTYLHPKSIENPETLEYALDLLGHRDVFPSKVRIIFGEWLMKISEGDMSRILSVRKALRINRDLKTLNKHELAKLCGA